MSDKEIGTVKWFDHTKGYGFLLTEGKDEVFVHYNDITMSGYRYLRRGQKVEFKLMEKGDGPKAVEVVVLEDAPVISEEQEQPVVNSGRSYKKNQYIVLEEDRENEFKSLKNSRDPVKTIGDYYVEKYVNAFLNTRGGVIYFGITDEGTVQGIKLDRTQRDQLRTEISHLINKFQPSVEPDLYKIEFVPVEGKDSNYVVEIHVSKGTATLYMTGSQNFFIRRDGSNFLMSFDMIRRRLQTKPQTVPVPLATQESKTARPAEGASMAPVSEEIDLGILLAMVFMSWSEEKLSENERNLLEARARAEGLDEQEVNTLHEAMMRPPLLNTIASYLPTPESRKAAVTIAYMTALTDSVVSENELQAFDKMCDALHLSDDEREDILQLGEQKLN